MICGGFFQLPYIKCYDYNLNLNQKYIMNFIRKYIVSRKLKKLHKRKKWIEFTASLARLSGDHSMVEKSKIEYQDYERQIAKLTSSN